MDDLSLLEETEGPDQARVRVRAFGYLVGVVQQLSLARSVAAVQEIVRHAARELTGADGATFVLREGDLCYYADEEAIAPLWKGSRFPMSACISGWSMIHRQPAVIEDIYADPRIPADAYRPTFVQSLAMVPIRSSQPIGAIGNYWASRHKATPTEVKLLQALADSTSVALENIALMEELERARRTAEAASRLKDEFLAMLSHEVHTPLNPVLGWASLIRDGELSPDEIAEAATTIVRCAEHQTRLIDDLIDVSQLASGTLELNLSDHELAPLIERVVADLEPQVTEKQVGLELRLRPAAGRVRGDAQRLGQVVRNLLSNALSFTPSEGRIGISLERVDDHFELSVRDSGVGIPSDFLPHAFEPFRQAEAGHSRHVGGLGLGLAIVRHLVELHGGSVSIQSQGKGQGTSCKVRIPALDQRLRSGPTASG